MNSFIAQKRRAKALAGIMVYLTVSLLPVLAQGMNAPSVKVNSQAIVDSKVVIETVVSDGNGWLVVHAQADGKPGPVIGYAPVKDGRNANVFVSVDSSRATGSLFAMLHTDAGSTGVYEFPGPDAPVKVDGNIVMSSFQVGESQAVRIDMKAMKFRFTPDTIRVKAGTPVELHIVSQDTTHGIRIEGLQINEKLKVGEETVVRFTPTETGRYDFACSVFCGSGHRSMRGELIVY
jgi:heme/copper-type cytochrome/quinol oxidase subunit 2